MRVEATVRRATVARAGSNGAAERSNGVFNVAGEGDAPAPATLQETAAAEAIGALLALQVVDDPLTGRRRALKGGLDLLDALDQLKLSLIGGMLSPDRVEGLSTAVGAMAPSGDPVLDRVLSEIDLRARVELAKLGRFPK